MKNLLLLALVALSPALSWAIDIKPWDSRLSALSSSRLIAQASATDPTAATASTPTASASSGVYFQHLVLTPSSVQGELFTGGMYTNAGWSQVTCLPAFYHNASADAPWYSPSWSPAAACYSAGGGFASGSLGPILDLGPQLVSGLEGGVSLISASAGQSVTAFFNCSASATACGSISAGILANGTFEENGQLVKTWHEFGAHPIGYFLGPSVRFGAH